MNNRIKKIVYLGVLISLCVLLPIFFHSVPNGGKIFAPMHIPVLITGLLLGPIEGIICGLLGPILSSIITGMPPATILPIMAGELVVYGLISGLVIIILGKNKVINIYISLLVAQISGRIVAGLLNSFILSQKSYTLKTWITSYFLVSSPAIILQLIIIPMTVKMLQKYFDSDGMLL